MNHIYKHCSRYLTPHKLVTDKRNSLTQLHLNVPPSSSLPSPPMSCVLALMCAWLKRKSSFFFVIFYVFFVFDALPREEIISVPKHNRIIPLSAIFNPHLPPHLLHISAIQGLYIIYFVPSLIQYLKSCLKISSLFMCNLIFSANLCFYTIHCSHAKKKRASRLNVLTRISTCMSA